MTRDPMDTAVLGAWPFPTKGVNKDVDQDKLGGNFFYSCKNAYMKDGQLIKVPGYLRIGTIQLAGAVQLIKELHLPDDTTVTVLACATEVYKFNPITETVTEITRYDVGDIDVTNGSAVVTTDHGSADFESHLKPGDKLIDVQGVTVAYEILTVDSDTQFTLTANWVGGTVADQTFIVQQVMSAAGFWRADEFLDILYLTNGVEILYRWDSTENFLEIVPDTPPVCKQVFGHGHHLFLGWLIDGDNYPRNVKWPDSNDPTNWSTGDAQERRMPADYGEIVGFEEIRSQLIVHRTNSQDYAEYYGGTWIFLTDRHAKGSGAIGQNAFLNMESGRFHIFVGMDDVYMFDGTPPKRMARGVIAQWLVDHVNPTFRSSVILFEDITSGLVYILYPTINVDSGYCDAGFILEPQTGTFYELDEVPNITATGQYHVYEAKYIDDYEDLIDDMLIFIDSVLFEDNAALTLLGDKDGKLWKLQGMNKVDGATTTAIDVEVITGTEMLDDVTQVKRLINFFFDADANASATVQIYIGVKSTPFAEWTWEGPFDLPKSGSTSEKVELFDGSSLPGVQGKYFCRKFIVSGVDTAFELRNMWYEKVMEGDR